MMTKVRPMQTAMMIWTAACAHAMAGDGEAQNDVALDAGFSVKVDFGRDIGQSFGTLFEAKNSDGHVVCGAGFCDVYNTRFRSGRRTLQFYVRPDRHRNPFELTRLPHPDIGCGVYLFEWDQQIYAWTSVGGNSVRRWDDGSGSWVNELPEGMPMLRSGEGIMSLGEGRLIFSGSGVWFNERQILKPPQVGRYYNFYYAAGHLFFFQLEEVDGRSVTRILACPWTPDASGGVDLGRASILVTKYDRETPFAWGQFGGKILTVSNMGGVYVFDPTRTAPGVVRSSEAETENAVTWRTLVAADNTKSYQVYSAVHWTDRLLLAQYPTGNILEYRGETPVRLNDWPPVLQGVSRSARECQTLGIYRGDLLAGVWPWAVLWRRDRSDAQWHSLGRLFTHPKITDQTTHPYEADANRQGLVTNHWGQRVTSMIPVGEHLFLATSSKGTSPWRDEWTFLSDSERREYGAVLKLHQAGNLAVPLRWTGKPTELEFRLHDGQMKIVQDGTIAGSARLPAEFSLGTKKLQVEWGKGVFGPCPGKLSEMLAN